MNITSNYAYYLISSKLVKSQLSAAAQQTKIRHTSPDKIKDCTVWIPDINTQKKVGDLLARIDRKIALNRAINQNLRASRVQSKLVLNCRGAAVNGDVSRNLETPGHSSVTAKARLAER